MSEKMRTIKRIYLKVSIALLGLVDPPNTYEATDFQATDRLKIEVDSVDATFTYEVAGMVAIVCVPRENIKQIVYSMEPKYKEEVPGPSDLDIAATKKFAKRK